MSKEAKIILVVSILFTLALGLSNIFVNIFLWKKSRDFTIVALYNLMHYIFVPITFILAGWLSKKKNGIWSLRLGIVFFILFFSLTLLIKDQMLRFIYPLGILFGIAAGFYWLAYHVLSFYGPTAQNRFTCYGFNGISVGGANALAPLIGGYIIQSAGNTKGYTIVFSCSLVLFFILILVSLLLKTKSYGTKLDFSHIWGSQHQDWTKLRKAITVWGFRDVVIGFLISTLVFKSTGSELSVGKLSLLAAALSSLAFLTQQKLIKPQRRVLSMTLGAALMFAAVWGLTWQIGYPTLLIFTVLDAMFTPFFIIPIASASFNVINEYHEENLRVEYVINKEIVLNIGRIISTTMLIGLLTFVKQTSVLNFFLLFLGSTQLVSVFFLRGMKVWKDKARST
ncbi:MAG: MFS transporter [Clostridia bacterium]|nr:MFS transporter [Clostridia bacterium]